MRLITIGYPHSKPRNWFHARHERKRDFMCGICHQDRSSFHQEKVRFDGVRYCFELLIISSQHAQNMLIFPSPLAVYIHGEKAENKIQIDAPMQRQAQLTHYLSCINIQTDRNHRIKESHRLFSIYR